MHEADLVRIRTALEKDTLEEACRAMERTLLDMGYYLAVPPRSSSSERIRREGGDIS